MTDKRKKRIREYAAATGMSYQASANALANAEKERTMSHSDFKEATIVVNGTQLSPAQSMAVRVAVNSFFGEMRKPERLGEDDQGEAIRAGYKARAGEVLALILGK